MEEIKQTNTNSKKSRRISYRHKQNIKNTSPKKELTSYQKYVKKESKSKKYDNISPKSRMKSIGNSWNKKNS